MDALVGPGIGVNVTDISASGDIISPASAGTDIAGSSDIIASSGIVGSSNVTALRQPHGDEWSTEDWRVYFDEKAGIAEYDHAMPREAAEALAVEHCVAEWLYHHPTFSDADDGCVICGDGDRAGNPLLAIGLGGGQVWLHRECSTTWRVARIAKAAAALAAMGMGRPEARST